MNKEIIKRGYLTHSLTDGNSFFYGLYKKEKYDWGREPSVYWSEVFVDGDAFALVHKGECVDDKSDAEKDELLRKSLVNLGTL